jgi:photosystem II stability/assembly factor-like uncharacterized protein
MHIKRILAIGVLLVAVSACTTQPDTSIPTPAVSLAATPIQLATLTDTANPPPPDLSVVPDQVLVRIDFQNADYGWGLASNNSGYILRTVDSGTTWLNATPPGVTGIGYSTGFFALNVNVAWVQIPNVDFFTGTLYHTTDGGVTWTSTAVPFGGAYIQFLDASNGHLLADRGAGAGSNAVELYQTSDGGMSWMSVFHNDPTRTGSSDALPLSGIKNGMVFLNTNTGWVTGSRPVDGEVYLYITHDGGVSWAKQMVPLPPGIITNQFLAQAPTFFGQDGYLPISIYYPGSVIQSFYVTHDGGITWSGDPTDTQKSLPSPGAYSFVDALNGFGWNGGANLYFTDDGATHWASLRPNIDLSGRLSQLEFIPGPDGNFTGWALTSMDESGHSQLYKTNDNGSNWTPLIP